MSDARPGPGVSPVTQVALLRGINVGRNNRISMARLRELVEALGCEEVRTYVQSGNVVFASAAAPERSARDIEDSIARQLGLAVSVLVRTGDELATVVAANPLADVATDPARHFVAFLSAPPDPLRLGELLGEEHSPDRLAVDCEHPLARASDQLGAMSAKKCSSSFQERPDGECGDGRASRARRVGEVYLWCPNGARDTRLTNAFVERRLGVISTARNWSTVTRLAAMAGE